MRPVTPTVFLAFSLCITLGGCTYLPDLLVSNLTEKEARLEIRFRAKDCRTPSARLMPATHASRTWRDRDISPAPPPSASLEGLVCVIRTIIPPDSALELEISEHYNWDSESGDHLSMLDSVSIEGTHGTLRASGTTAINLFEKIGIGAYLWEYGPS